MDLIPIGAAAQRLDLATSTLRYYDERGLVPAATRKHGKRMYGLDQLRRLAFIKLVQHLGIPLKTAASILDTSGPRWREAVREETAKLDELIERAQGARTFLTHSLECPHAHPVQDCPNMISALDQLTAGATMDQLRQQYT
ncbi:MerR family transcriptional regulator [Saccharopolyspora sp. K220]|uniref:MerR family transcriptional regulator n=1 Tax=Saccharopolyspora soli TaxID=2926618 RepID=UPI001F59BCB9|nr:MerR family transcriptional regulator [Saccharopolyspora soli]MCI2424104.1 MerR family transcriptional regulator [Saccharopolyspora soli]